jgi:phosphatidyl-myo-inositol alpha-mannosyltransferase
MKIAQVSAYDFAFPGGVNSHIANLEQRLRNMGHEVKIVAPFTKGHAALPPNVIPFGGSIPYPSGGSIARCSPSPFFTQMMKATLEKEHFDIIHIHEPLTPMLPLTVLRALRDTKEPPTVGTFHAYHNTPRGYRCFKPLIKGYFNRLDALTAVSKPAKDFVSQVFPGNYTIIPNGIELEHFSPQVTPMPELMDGKLNILFVSRLEKRKGLDYLLGAYPLIKKQLPQARLIIVGPGTRLRKGYEATVERGNLQDVQFVGYVSQDDLPRYYRSAHVFCAPATGHESFGIVLLEAMAMAKPIVATNIPGYAGVMSHGVEGLLVPPKDKTALAQAIITLLLDEQLRLEMSARGRAKAEEYSWTHVIKKVMSIYADVLNRKSNGARIDQPQMSSISS